MATPVPSETDDECSAANASDRKGSFVVSADPQAVQPRRLGGRHPVGHPGNFAPEAACRSSSDRPVLPVAAPAPAWAPDPSPPARPPTASAGCPPARSVPPPGGGSAAAGHAPRPGGRRARRRVHAQRGGDARVTQPRQHLRPPSATRPPPPRPRPSAQTQPTSSARASAARCSSRHTAHRHPPVLGSVQTAPHRGPSQIRAHLVGHRTGRTPATPRPRTGTASPSGPTRRPPSVTATPRARPSSASTIPAASSSPVP